jgi:hypothetical protein
MLYENNFPEFLQSICIGPSPEFLQKNTTNCEFLSAFPQEVELMYDWKAVKKSSDPLNALRTFVKKFTVYGPDLDVQTLKFFVRKCNNYPRYYGDLVKDELDDAFEQAKKIKVYDDYDPNSIFITKRRPINLDIPFLNKIASMLRTCKKPCNYFKPLSDSLGTLTDFQRGLSTSASMLGDVLSDALHAPLNIATHVYNKYNPVFRTEFTKLKVASENVVKLGIMPFFSESDRQTMKKIAREGRTIDVGHRFPLTGDTRTYHSISEIYSEAVAAQQSKLGDCFRMHDYNNRFNPYDPTMNLAYSKVKYMGIKNGNVSSLVDATGQLAPGQYATENTFRKALDVPNNPNYRRYDDSPTTPLYDSFNGPSGASSSMVVGGAKSIKEQTNDLTNSETPTNGKVYEFGFGEVKVTEYGYAKDECPDTGSEIGLGHGRKSNLLIPLKTIAVAPEILKSGIVKSGDVLIITCTDRNNNTWVEKRHVGDTSGGGLLSKGGNYKFLIDEYIPDKTKFKSKMSANFKNIKMKIQIADTKEPLAKWTPQEASLYASMFNNRSDWERVKRMGGTSFQSYVKRMDTEFIKYVRWSESDPIDQKFINNKGC